MYRKVVLLASLALVWGLASVASADLTVPEDTTYIQDGDLTDDGVVEVAGHLIVESGNILFQSRSNIDGPNNVGTGGTRPEITVNDGFFHIDARFDMGQGDDAYLTINGGTFRVGTEASTEDNGDLKFPDNPGGTHRIWLNGGILRVHRLQLDADRDPQIIVGAGALQIEDLGQGDPAEWLTEINEDINEPVLVPAEGFIGVIITYDVPVAGGAEVTAVQAGPYAENPNPAKGATGLCPDGTKLSWTPTDAIAEPNHDVYLDANLDDVTQATRASHGNVLYYSENQDSNEYTAPGALQVGTTYYWRVDEVDNTNPGDPNVWENPFIWSFTTEDGNAHTPDPPDGRRGVNPADVVLRWTPSCLATATQVVYFSTDFSDVNTMQPAALEHTVSAADNNCPVGALDTYTTYYWRIKTDLGGNGEVWEFKTGYGGLLMHYSFEGSLGANITDPVTDDTGNITFYRYNGGGSLKYGDGRYIGTSAAFDPNVGLYRDDTGDNDPLRLDGYQYTIQMWIKADVLPEEGRPRVMDKANSWAIEIDNEDSQVVFRHAGETLGMPDGIMFAGEWCHFTAIYDATAEDEEQRIYANGALFEDIEDAGSPNPADNNEPVTIGYRRLDDVNVDQFFDGSIDELKIWDIVVVPVLECSTDPSPPDMADRLDPNDPNNTVLSWTPGVGTQYDVYFGTEANNVVYQDRVDANRYPAASNLLLEKGKTYYWRVDDVDGGDVYEGFTWRFSTTSVVEDPNMSVWYKLDETDGDDVEDSSGFYNHGDTDGDEGWDPNDGRFGGSCWFDDDLVIDIPGEAAANIGPAISVSCWLKDCDRPDYDNWVFGLGDEDGVFIGAAVVDGGGREVYFQAGNDTNDVITWDMVQEGLDPGSIEGWHHWVFVKDETAGNIRMYFDAQVVESNDVVNETIAGLRSEEMSIGRVPWHSADLRGKVDDFRMYDKALSDQEVTSLFRGGDLERAWAPDPFDGKPEVPRDATLIWRPGDFVEKHDVYLGTDWYDVNDADTTSDVYIGREPANSYDPTSNFALGTTYYWRVDEVNETDPNIWKGHVWSFSVANYIIIDSFETYTSDGEMYVKWKDGWENDTGSTLLLSAAGDPTHTGEKSMLYSYNNVGSPYYSEAERVLGAGEQDFTETGVKLLTMYFYGKSTNTATTKEQLYAGLDDGGTYAEVRYGTQEGESITDIQLEDWSEWNVDLSDFTDVTLNSVDGLFIGFGSRSASSAGGMGLVFFDDIRLYPPKCVAQYAPEYDFSTRLGRDNECTVDLADVGVMAEEWLRADACLPATAPGTGPVGWWKLEQNADDSSNAYNGIAEGDYEWVAGKVDSYAVELDGGWVYVADAGATPKLRPSSNTVSVMAWIKLRRSVEDDTRVVIKGRNDHEGYGLEVNPEGGLTFLIRDVNGEKESVDSEVSLPIGSWVHCAGTYDGNNLVSYVDGDVDLSNQIGAIVLMADVNDGLGIGGRWGDTGSSGRFPGTIDEARVYDYGLSAANVAYVALGPSGYKPVTAMSNIYDKEPSGNQAVNFKDFALLMTKWLEKKLWPE